LVDFDPKTGKPNLRGQVFPKSAVVVPNSDGTRGLVIGKPDEAWLKKFIHWGVTDNPPVLGTNAPKTPMIFGPAIQPQAGPSGGQSTYKDGYRQRNPKTGEVREWSEKSQAFVPVTQ
jgi:hypothetical protein